MRTLFVMLFGLMFAGGGGAWCAFSADNAKSAGPKATAARDATRHKVTAVGTVEPEEVVDVCAQAAGRIVSFGADPHAQGKSIDYGSAVEVGTVLAQIESALYATRVEQERGGLMRAEVELAQAGINLENAEALWKSVQDQNKSKAIPDSALLSKCRSYKLAKLAVALAEGVLIEHKAALKRAEIELGYTTIKSPIKGVIIDRRVNVGQMVTPANAAGLFLVAKLDKLQVWASVTEVDVPQVRAQQPVRFTVDAYPGKVFTGKVKQIRLNATMTQNVVTYTVVVAISSATQELLPYMTANLEFD